jgi:hypothetical protein
MVKPTLRQSIYLGIANIFCGLLFIAISIPLLKDSIKMNRYYGIRFQKSYESEENCYKINKFGAILPKTALKNGTKLIQPIP